MQQLTFSRMARGVYAASVSEGVSLVLSTSGAAYGWNVTLRSGGKILARLGSGIRTLSQAKATAISLAGSDRFAAVLLKFALAA